MFTELINYRLWFDGTKSYNYTQLCNSFYTDGNILPSVVIHDRCEDIERYEQLTYKLFPIKKDCDHLNYDYKSTIDMSFDLYDYIIDKFIDMHAESLDDPVIITQKLTRIDVEWQHFISSSKTELLYLSIHIKNKLNSLNIPWGTRGSCTACYILYVIGVHNIDSFKYGINLNEFFKI